MRCYWNWIFGQRSLKEQKFWQKKRRKKWHATKKKKKSTMWTVWNTHFHRGNVIEPYSCDDALCIRLIQTNDATTLYSFRSFIWTLHHLRCWQFGVIVLRFCGSFVCCVAYTLLLFITAFAYYNSNTHSFVPNVKWQHIYASKGWFLMCFLFCSPLFRLEWIAIIYRKWNW